MIEKNKREKSDPGGTRSNHRSAAFQMTHSFNIYQQSEAEFHLLPGRYYIYLSGGYSVSLGLYFKLFITNTETSEKIPVKKTSKVRSRIKGKRSVRLYEIHIPKDGNYSITMKGADEVVVRKSMLNLMKLIQKKTDESEIELVISNE